MMELKWTSKALPDLVRLYDFPAPVNKQAAARIVQSLAGSSGGVPGTVYLILDIF
jgi:plasmid stabilization system protein ParE